MKKFLAAGAIAATILGGSSLPAFAETAPTNACIDIPAGSAGDPFGITSVSHPGHQLGCVDTGIPLPGATADQQKAADVLSQFVNQRLAEAHTAGHSAWNQTAPVRSEARAWGDAVRDDVRNNVRDIRRAARDTRARVTNDASRQVNDAQDAIALWQDAIERDVEMLGTTVEGIAADPEGFFETTTGIDPQSQNGDGSSIGDGPAVGTPDGDQDAGDVYEDTLASAGVGVYENTVCTYNTYDDGEDYAQDYLVEEYVAQDLRCYATDYLLGDYVANYLIDYVDGIVPGLLPKDVVRGVVGDLLDLVNGRSSMPEPSVTAPPVEEPAIDNALTGDGQQQPDEGDRPDVEGIMTSLVADAEGELGGLQLDEPSQSEVEGVITQIESIVAGVTSEISGLVPSDPAGAALSAAEGGAGTVGATIGTTGQDLRDLVDGLEQDLRAAAESMGSNEDPAVGRARAIVDSLVTAITDEVEAFASWASGKLPL